MKMGTRRKFSTETLVGRMQKSSQRGNSERENGSIVRIKLDNFLYEYTVLFLLFTCIRTDISVLTELKPY